MSLKVRLPLDGNLENKGLDLIAVANNGATINSSGKIGQCYLFDGVDDYISLQGITKYFKGGSTPFSICFWIYHSGNNRRGVIFGGYGITSTSEAISLEVKTDNNFRFWWKSNPDWAPFSITTQTWTHIAVVYDGTKLVIYKDGVPYTRTGTLNAMNASGELRLGRDSRTGDAAFNGKINDFRLYDHALSKKEVIEIYRSLVIHYKFNEYNILRSTCQNIVWNQAIRSITLATDMASLDNTLPSERKYVIKNTRTSSNRFIYTAGTTIPVDHKAAVYIKFKSNFTQRPYLRYAKASGSYTSLYPSNYIVDEWCEIKGIISGFLPGSASGILPNSNGYVADEYFSLPKEGGFMIFDLTEMFGAGNEPSLKDFFGMFPNLNYPYDVGTTMSFVEPVPDSSGYERNGTIQGSLTLSEDSARYDRCTNFNGSSFIQGPVLPSGVSQSATLWVYIGDSVPYQAVIFVDSESKLALGFWRYNLIVACRTSCPGVFGYSTLKLNSWNHIGIVRPTGSSGPTLYINGQQISSISSDYWSIVGSEFTVGRRNSKTSYLDYTGQLSDFRLYAVALTQEDIKDIMTQTSLDNHGNLFCYELDESTAVKVNKTGIVNTKAINEETLSGVQARITKAKEFIVNEIIEK